MFASCLSWTAKDHVLAMRGDPLDRWCTVYQSAVASHLCATSDKVVKTNNATTAGKISQYYKTSHNKTSPRQTTKLQISTSVINDIVADTINSSKVNVNPASEGKTTEAQDLENDAEMSASSASEDDIQEYNMSGLEETSEESSDQICTPHRPRKCNFGGIDIEDNSYRNHPDQAQTFPVHLYLRRCNSSSAETGVIVAITGHSPTPIALSSAVGNPKPLLFSPGK
ncbi:hypothetical protein AVEN_168277-1 [Araneus ventricosus]|uniref:Uncharacterized protein n=1 Tax=Araneus ventricosus TaxID=182803 RepID=A0A4Y2FZV8_ARAVE|nr:hypothetical protein AVEN_168277-1 [Araneus ventricosus]